MRSLPGLNRKRAIVSSMRLSSTWHRHSNASTPLPPNFWEMVRGFGRVPFGDAEDSYDNFEIPLDGTPCEAVLNGKFSHHPEQICQLFPTDTRPQAVGVESYCGVPLLDSSGMVVGHLAILSERPMWDGPRGLATMRIFAARARAELERLRIEEELRAGGK